MVLVLLLQLHHEVVLVLLLDLLPVLHLCLCLLLLMVLVVHLLELLLLHLHLLLHLLHHVLQLLRCHLLHLLWRQKVWPRECRVGLGRLLLRCVERRRTLLVCGVLLLVLCLHLVLLRMRLLVCLTLCLYLCLGLGLRLLLLLKDEALEQLLLVHGLDLPAGRRHARRTHGAAAAALQLQLPQKLRRKTAHDFAATCIAGRVRAAACVEHTRLACPVGACRACAVDGRRVCRHDVLRHAAPAPARAKRCML